MEPTELCWQTGNLVIAYVNFVTTKMSAVVMKMRKTMIKEYGSSLCDHCLFCTFKSIIYKHNG